MLCQRAKHGIHHTEREVFKWLENLPLHLGSVSVLVLTLQAWLHIDKYGEMLYSACAD